MWKQVCRFLWIKKIYSLFHCKWLNTPVTLVYAFKTSICGRRHVLSAALGGFYIPVNEWSLNVWVHEGVYVCACVGARVCVQHMHATVLQCVWCILLLSISMDKCLILMCVHESLLLLSTGATVGFCLFFFPQRTFPHLNLHQVFRFAMCQLPICRYFCCLCCK